MEALLGQGLRTSRRGFLRGTGTAAVAASVNSASGSLFCAEAQDNATDTIYRNGPIITMDDRRPTAEAVLVRGGRIVAVGARDEVSHIAKSNARFVDLSGKTMLPGFFDPHGHVVMTGLQALSANLLPAPDGPGNDIAGVQRALREWMAKSVRIIERYKIIVGFGYDDSQLREQRHPTRDDLDAVSSDLPILIIHQSGHLGVVNSKALEVAKVTSDTKDPVGGTFRRKPGSMEPNGICEEHAFFRVFGALAVGFDQDAFLGMIKAGAESYARFGYTTCQEARAVSATAAMLQVAADRGMLLVDVLCYPDIISAPGAIKPSREYRNRYRVGGAKLTIDGSPQGKTAWLSRPYFVPPDGKSADYVGYAALSNDKTIAAFDLAFEKGWQIIAHANGDAAIDVLIAGIREATKKHGKADRRPVLIHGQTCREDQLDELKELGTIPSFFPMHTFYWGDWHRESVLGPERAENISPCGSALRKGMIFTSHHDAPVAKPDSMRVLSATVTRRTRSGDILGPHQRVSVVNALKAMTLWAAHQHFEEKTKGSVEVGKLADLVVLSANPLTVPPERLADLRVIETIKEGASIYRAS